MKNMLRWGGLGGLVVALAMVGCTGRVESLSDSGSGGSPATGGSGTSTEAGTPANPGTGAARPHLTRSGKPPAESDTLLLIYGSDPDTLNLITSNDSQSSTFQMFVYEPLAERTFDDPDTFEPVLAESWEFDEPTLTYTIHLRKGVMWHPIALPNGKELPPREFTSKDVKFTFDCILNPQVEAAALRSYYDNPDAKNDAQRYKIKVTVVDKYTVKVKWTEPYLLATEFTLGIGIMPRHVYSVDENGEPISFDFASKEFADGFNNHWANTTMCGTGPMIFKEWRKEQEVTLERNPNYWGEPFYFSRIVYQYNSNPNTALQKTLQGDVDWAGIPEKDLYIQSQDHPNVKAGKVKLVQYDYPGYRYMGYNLRRDFFKDAKVRWALSHAVPVDEIIGKLYYGLAVRVTGPFLPGSPANDPDLKPVEYNLEKARQLLDEAGWVDSDQDGTRDKIVAGEKVPARFDLMIYSDSPSYKSIAEIVQENCRKIGVEVILTPAKWPLMLQKLRKKEFDATILGWALSWRGDPFQIWHGSQADLPESSNSIGYANPEVDKLIETLRRTLDEKKQTELYREIHRLIYADQPYTFLFSEKATAGLNARIQNVKFYPIRPGYDMREWWATSPRLLGQ